MSHSDLFVPLIIHAKYNNKWGHAVDCGIHHGSYSALFAELFDIVTSIDAIVHPQAMENLSRFDNVNTVSQCLFSTTGDYMTFYEVGSDAALNTLDVDFLKHNDHDPSSIVEHTLTTARLDDIFDTPIDYLKTDLEGSDADVISGAVDLIDRYRPTVITDPDPKIARLLSTLNYQRYVAADTFGVGSEFSSNDAIYLPIERLI